MTVGYVAPTVVGASRTAHIAVSGAPPGREIGVAVLCRRPGPDGSIGPGESARAAATGGGRPAAVCRTHAYLHTTPGGGTAGSVRLAQPVRILSRAPGWRRVRTDLGDAGWVRASALCG